VHSPANNLDAALRERFLRIPLAYVFFCAPVVFFVASSLCIAGNAMHVTKRQGRDRLFATVTVGSSENE